MPHLHVALVPAPDQVVVRLTGDADLSTLPRLTAGLQAAAGLGTGRVVVDVAGARFWDCSGLHALTDFTAALAPAGRQCRVVGAPAATRRLVAAAGLADRLELDGPLGGQDPVRPPTAAAPAPLAEVPAGPAPVRRPPAAPRALRGMELAGDRTVGAGRCAGAGTLRRWR